MHKSTMYSALKHRNPALKTFAKVMHPSVHLNTMNTNHSLRQESKAQEVLNFDDLLYEIDQLMLLVDGGCDLHLNAELTWNENEIDNV